MGNKDNNRVKIIFELQQDEDGWPPCGSESLWAVRIPDGLFRLDNTPFFARGIAWQDIISADSIGNELVFREVIEHSGHSTLRVIFMDQTKKDEVCQKLKALGCSIEQSHLPSLIAIDIPPMAMLTKIRDYLESCKLEHLLDYEEGCLAEDQ